MSLTSAPLLPLLLPAAAAGEHCRRKQKQLKLRRAKEAENKKQIRSCSFFKTGDRDDGGGSALSALGCCTRLGYPISIHLEFLNFSLEGFSAEVRKGSLGQVGPRTLECRGRGRSMSREGRSRVLRRLIIKSSRSAADADAAALALNAETEHYQAHLDKLDRFRAATHSHAQQMSDIQLWMEELAYLQRQRGRLEKEVSSHMREFILLDPSFAMPPDIMDSIEQQQTEIGLVRQISDIRDIFQQWRRKPSCSENEQRSIIGELLYSSRKNVDEMVRRISEEECKLVAEVGDSRQMVI